MAAAILQEQLMKKNDREEYNSCSFHGVCFQSKPVPTSVNKNEMKQSLSAAKQKQEQEQKDNEQSKFEGADRASVISHHM
jgi:hypothetical protein